MIFKKQKSISTSQNKSKLDQVLWLIENYLPQKKNKIRKKELSNENSEVKTINHLEKILPLFTNSLRSNKTSTKVSFTFGTWALPYLKFLKQIGLAK